MNLLDYDSCKDRFQAQDADIELECAPITSNGTDTDDTPPSCKVHINKLAAISPVFADMLAVSDTSAACEDTRAGGPHKVRVDEAWTIIYIILGCAYNEEGIIASLRLTKDFHFALEIYEASKKYQIHTLAELSSSHLW